MLEAYYLAVTLNIGGKLFSVHFKINKYTLNTGGTLFSGHPKCYLKDVFSNVTL